MTLRAVASASPGDSEDHVGPTVEVGDVSAAMCVSGAGVRIYTPWPVPGNASTPPGRGFRIPVLPPALSLGMSSMARPGRVWRHSSISTAR
jgi:hypothetical protein